MNKRASQATLQRVNARLAGMWSQIGTQFLPFADAVSERLPLSRLLRLALFQVSVGMAVVLLTGTLNRVMIVELLVPTWLVASMISLPLLVAPFRALIGHRSDMHVSALGWRRVPYIWIGTMLQFGGLAIMPFALLVLSGDTHGPVLYGQIGAALAFLLVGAGLHTTQTAGLALATDLADDDNRAQVVALLYVMLLLGMFCSALLFGWLLSDFTQLKLIKVVQGAAAVTVVLNGIALWKQEARQPQHTRADRERVPFRAAWRELLAQNGALRLLLAVAIGSAAFSMQDVLLEPFGGEILGLSVAQTTLLTALLAGGMLLAFMFAAQKLRHGTDANLLAAIGVLVGIAAFSAVLLADVLQAANLFRVGTLMIGFGGGLFAVGTLTAAMRLAEHMQAGIALGAWGAVQATAVGLAVAIGGGVRDLVSSLALSGTLGQALQSPSTGYGFVYYLEIVLLFAALAVIGPLVKYAGSGATRSQQAKFGMAEFPN